MPDARPAVPDPLALPPSLDSPQPGSSPSNSARFAARPHVDPGAPAWQGIKDDSISVKALGTGLSLGRKMSISVFDNEVSVDMSHLLTRTSTALGFGSPQPAAKPEPVAAPFSSSELEAVARA